MREQPKTKIYFIATRDEKYVKIGISISPRHRLREFLQSHPEEDALRLIKEFEGSYADEADLHAQFSGFRAKGEWFHFTEEIRVFLDLREIAPAITRRPRSLLTTNEKVKIREAVLRGDYG